MTDATRALVERLRAWEARMSAMYGDSQSPVAGEAADEIERLQAYIEEILQKDSDKTREINLLVQEVRSIAAAEHIARTCVIVMKRNIAAAIRARKDGATLRADAEPAASDAEAAET